MKKSKYTRIIPVKNDAFLLHNIASGSECIIDSHEKVLIEKEDYDNDPFFTTLYEMGFLVDDEIDEEACLELERRIHTYAHINTEFGLVIAPTMDCNARCFYCYENETRKKLYMSDETKEDLIQYILRNASGKQKVFISWFGGEPLLTSDFIKQISDVIIQYCNENSIEYEAELTTNGYYLNRILEYITELCIDDIQVTIDGYAEEYENRKNYINTGDSWNRVVANIFEVSEKGNHITIRMNFDKKNIESIKKATEYLIKNPRWNSNISIYYYPLEPCGEAKDVNRFFDESEYESIFDELYWHLYELHYFDERSMALDFVKLSLPCYGGTLSTTAVDYAGNIYQCQHLLCRNEYKIGDLKKGIVIDQALMKWYDGSLPKSCIGCDVLPLCQGGCVTKRKLGQDKYLCHMLKYRISIMEKIKATFYRKEL